MKINHLLAALLVLSVWGCSKNETEVGVTTPPVTIETNEVVGVADSKANTNPQWKVGAICFNNGPVGAFDEVSVKDPSIVYSGGKWHMYYTGVQGSNWKIGYASATTISGLNSSTHTLVSSIGTGGGLAAPQVFYFPTKGSWFMIYQNGRIPSFSTNSDIANPAQWTKATSMGFSDDGIDYWCISNGANVYLFYSAADGSHTIKRRSTTVAKFPYGWSESTVVATETFEGVHVYKNKADGRYYMVVEGMGASRWQELWTAATLGGIWTKVSEQWAHKSDLVYTAEHWTDQVSHMELIRSGTDEKLEIDDIDRCQMLIQGVPDGSYPSYIAIPYRIGLISNY